MRAGFVACLVAAMVLPGHARSGTGTGTGTYETPGPPAATRAAALAPATATAAAPTPTLDPQPSPIPTITTLPIDDDLPVFVVPPSPGTRPARTVFLTGSCTTPITYLERIREAAASHGGIIALQGDKPCRDGSRRWSPDTISTAARIDAALRAAGFDDLTDITLVGYSQGAERAEWLAHRFPAKYTRFILMAGPILPSHARFSEARAIVTLAGYGDVRENMANGAKRLRRAAIPAIYMELPGVQHGELAPAANDVVAQAFDWLDANATSKEEAHAKEVDRRRRLVAERARDARDRRVDLPRKPRGQRGRE